MIHDDSTDRRPDGHNDDDAQRPSKTQRKKEMHALQALGQQLVDLSRDQLARIDLPDELREAVDFAHRVTSHEGRRRHLQYIGKLMRQVDAEEIRTAIGHATGESRAAVAQMHFAERWRDRLLDDDDALTAFIADHPLADVQWLRATIRAARREHEAGQAPKHARVLYRWLHDHLTPNAPTEPAHEG
jgi:ribosome-associated protein